MPLLAATLTPLMVGQFASSAMTGTFTPPMCSALSQGIALHLITAEVITVDVGIMGVGTGIGKVVGPTPPVLQGLLLGQFAANGMTGTYTTPMSTAIATSFCTWFLANNLVNTIDPGVAVGAGVGTVIGLVPSVMQGLIIGFMASNGITGPFSLLLAAAVANAVCTVVMTTGIVNTVIAGAPAPIPPVPGGGAGVGKLS